ncbi:hypothetical protein C6A85_71380, partial [Mycobacterium sp. ITM-2017-0098]
QEADDPMAETVIAVDSAHETQDAGRAVNSWQREQMNRWRGGDHRAPSTANVTSAAQYNGLAARSPP